jgi:chromosome segregation ATPase
MKKKSEYNSVIHMKVALQSDITLLNQKVSDLRAPHKAEQDREIRIKTLEKHLESLQNRIQDESLNSEVLRHMVDTRKKWLDDIEDPTRALRKKILHLHVTNQTLDREAEYHVTVARTIKAKIDELKEKIESQKDFMQATSTRELAKYETRYKAIEFFKQSQIIWHKRKMLENKTVEIKKLESQEEETKKEQNLMKEFEITQLVTAERELNITKALKETNLHSLSDLNSRLIQMRDTKESLIILQKDLEERILEQKKEIENLNKKYEKVSLSQIEKEEYGYHTLYKLEMDVASQESNLGHQESFHSKTKEICSAGLLGLYKLIDIVSNVEEARNFRTVKEFIDYICDSFR